MFINPKRLWGKAPLRSSYDAVLIGGGIHGLAAATWILLMAKR